MMSGNFSTLGSFSFLYGFHKLFALAFFLGLIFFIAWALKNLKKDQLKNWAITLLIIGIVGWLLTVSFGSLGFSRYGALKGFGLGTMGPGMMGQFSDCVSDDECFEEMETLMDRMMGHDE